MKRPKSAAPAAPSIFSILTPYRAVIALLAVLALLANSLTLWVPKVISHAIDGFAHHTLHLHDVAWELGLIALGIFLFTYLQNIVQVFASERVAKDIRNSIAEKISQQSFAYTQQVTPGRLLTNLTSDMDSVKLFVAQAVASLISSFFLIIGASVLLLTIDWQLGLATLIIVPAIALIFFLTLRKVRALFLKTREVIDRLNRVINESILGAALIRVLNSQSKESDKFEATNTEARNLGITLVRIFSRLIPAITFVANAATLIILTLGGHFIITGHLSIGDFAAFNTYIAILIFPILIIGFMSNIIAQASASYARIAEVLNAPVPKDEGTLETELRGNITVKDLLIEYGEKKALKEVSFTIKPATRVAVIGPTAAGKTQLLYAMTGLIQPTKGNITYDGHPISEYRGEVFYRQIGLVFQDSVIFNMSVRENIGFNTAVTDADMEKAIDTAELGDFISSLPKGLDTVISERGTSLSGGQKQRLMLARALALNPRILSLDDFTARVDVATEQRILGNLRKNYPDLTLISVTQKIGAIQAYDQIIVLMEGELLGQGTHAHLMKESPEYVQIYNSQRSTSSYELHTQ